MAIDTNTLEAQASLGCWPAVVDAISALQDGLNATEQSVDAVIALGDVVTLNATPKTLVPAPGAGKALVFTGAIFYLDFQTTAYDGIAAGEDLSIKYENAAGAEVAQVEATGFMDATAKAVRYVFPKTTAAITPVANKALVLHMLTGEIATGDSPLKVRVFYKVIPVVL